MGNLYSGICPTQNKEHSQCLSIQPPYSVSPGSNDHSFLGTRSRNNLSRFRASIPSCSASFTSSIATLPGSSASLCNNLIASSGFTLISFLISRDRQGWNTFHSFDAEHHSFNFSIVTNLVSVCPVMNTGFARLSIGFRAVWLRTVNIRATNLFILHSSPPFIQGMGRAGELTHSISPLSRAFVGIIGLPSSVWIPVSTLHRGLCVVSLCRSGFSHSFTLPFLLAPIALALAYRPKSFLGIYMDISYQGPASVLFLSIRTPIAYLRRKLRPLRDLLLFGWPAYCAG